MLCPYFQGTSFPFYNYVKVDLHHLEHILKVNLFYLVFWSAQWIQCCLVVVWWEPLHCSVWCHHLFCDIMRMPGCLFPVLAACLLIMLISPEASRDPWRWHGSSRLQAGVHHSSLSQKVGNTGYTLVKKDHTHKFLKGGKMSLMNER